MLILMLDISEGGKNEQVMVRKSRRGNENGGKVNKRSKLGGKISLLFVLTIERFERFCVFGLKSLLKIQLTRSAQYILRWAIFSFL